MASKVQTFLKLNEVVDHFLKLAKGKMMAAIKLAMEAWNEGLLIPLDYTTEEQAPLCVDTEAARADVWFVGTHFNFLATTKEAATAMIVQKNKQRVKGAKSFETLDIYNGIEAAVKARLGFLMAQAQITAKFKDLLDVNDPQLLAEADLFGDDMTLPKLGERMFMPWKKFDEAEAALLLDWRTQFSEGHGDSTPDDTDRKDVLPLHRKTWRALLDHNAKRKTPLIVPDIVLVEIVMGETVGDRYKETRRWLVARSFMSKVFLHLFHTQRRERQTEHRGQGVNFHAFSNNVVAGYACAQWHRGKNESLVAEREARKAKNDVRRQRDKDGTAWSNKAFALLGVTTEEDNNG
jgi:hypothetical protein